MAKSFREALPSNEAQAEFDQGLVLGDVRRECEGCAGGSVFFNLCQGRTRVFVVVKHVASRGTTHYLVGQVDGNYSTPGIDKNVSYVMERTLTGLMREVGCAPSVRRGAFW